MAWNDRLREAAYTSPSGARIAFDYESVQKSVSKKTTGFNFPDANGTYVQDLGHTGRRYPLRVIFWGGDYDIQANAFEEILLEIGTGKLEHPIYGVVDVVPFGDITRRDDLVTAANQAILEVTFWETIGIVYPTSQRDPGSAVLLSVSEYNSAAAETFKRDTKLTGAVSKETFKNKYSALLNSAKSSLQSIANAQADTKKQFDTVAKSIEQGLSILVDTPITLAAQTNTLLQTPARAATSVSDRLDTYGGLITALVGRGNDLSSNDFHTEDLYVSTYVTGSILSAVNNQFETKVEAVEAADTILTQMEAVTAWRDTNFESLNEIDTGETYQQLLDAVSLAAGFLVQISFSLKQERRIVLDRSRTIIDLVAEIYGEVDEQLDFLINTNNLSGSEILELPRGREIVYYI